MTKSYFIEATNLVKRYAGTVALDEVDFAVGPGEVVGLVGKNGAGKSTLIKLLGGVERPNSGTIRIDGHATANDYSSRQAAAQGTAVVYQELAVVPTMSVAENVALGHGFPHKFGFISWRALRRRVSGILDDLIDGIDPRAIVASLSPAQQRIVMIGQALYRDAKVLILDEPTAALSQMEIDHLHRIVHDWAKRGGAVVYVSHRLDEILRITDRVVVMLNGKVSSRQSTAALTRERLVALISGIRDSKATPSAQGTLNPPSASTRDDKPIVLSARHLRRGNLVRDVSLDLYAGEILGLGGLVGAGRSELARVLAGVDRPQAGEIRFDGRRVRFRTPADALQTGIALLPEDRRNAGLLVNEDIRTNVTLAALGGHRIPRTPIPSRRRETAAAREMIRALAVAASGPDQLVRTLSGGNQQKIVMGKYSLRNPRVFIADEPTLGVDVEAKREIFFLLRRMADAGASVVIICSEFSELVEWADRVVCLSQGRLTGVLAGNDITENRIIELSYEHRESA